MGRFGLPPLGGRSMHSLPSSGAYNSSWRGARRNTGLSTTSAGASLHGGSSNARGSRRTARAMRTAVVVLALLGVVTVTVWWRAARTTPLRLPAYTTAPVLVSYAYFEKDPIQLANFEYFLATATKSSGVLEPNVHFVFVVSGERCSPCAGLSGMLTQREPEDLSLLGIKEAKYSEKLSLLVRNENAGMDLGSHNVTLEWLASRGQLSRYAYYIFINSSAKGPFMPSWVPPEWHWTAAFLSRFQSPPYMPGAVGTTQQLPQQQLARPPAVHAVGASLVCLPEGDAGGPGPRLETWAFALDQDGLAVAVDAGVFIMRGCKLCPSATDGVVVGGEYGLTKAMFAAGYNVATLMSRYAPGIDWRDRSHWECNNNVHPSRAGTYDGVSMHPFETLFVKSSWHVADVYTRRYAAWTLGHMLGRPGTDGVTDRRLYLYAISERAQHPKDLESAYRPVLE